MRDTYSSTTAANYTLWQQWLVRISQPILEPMAQGRLHQQMPVEARTADRGCYTHLEAFGRLLCGIAPWLARGEGEEHHRLRAWALAALDQAVTPSAPDYLNFHEGRQPVVDAAFLCLGLLRAPALFIDGLSTPTRMHLITALQCTRQMLPYSNNWLLFSAIVEAALFRLGVSWDAMRVDYALRQHDQWYVGDGQYGDGPAFHWDYYNSFVIHPMLVELMRVVKETEYKWEWGWLEERVYARAARYAAVLERLISPEGTIPPIGRSLAYRFGNLHALAQAVWLEFLPSALPPAQVRCAMHAVIARMIEAPDTFDEYGYLTIGYCGHQPAIGEDYISTGSLYLCVSAFLPLGLAPDHPFWTDPAMPWTQVRAYAGENLPADHAIR